MISMPRGLVEHCLPLDVRRLVRRRIRAGAFEWSGGASIGYELDVAGARLDLAYRVQGVGAIRQSIALGSTPCHLGGARTWAHCPACDRRVAILLARPGGLFGCRACTRVTYASTRASAFSRACRRARKNRRRLRGSTALAAPFPPRPRGMWASTYARIRREGLALESRVFGVRLDG
jgi:hypothetical protein